MPCVNNHCKLSSPQRSTRHTRTVLSILALTTFSPSCEVITGIRPYEAEPILVLTRREGASFVLDPTSHRMHLRYQVLPASFPAFPAPSPANDSARVSLRWFMPYTTPANFPASYSLTNSFSPNTRMQFDSYAYSIPLHEYILQWVWKIYHRSRILRPAFFMAS